MRILIAIAAFAVTAGVLFVFNSGRLTTPPANSLALIHNTSSTPSATLPTPTQSVAGRGSSIPKPKQNPGGTETVISPTPSFDISVLSQVPLLFHLKQSANLEIKTLPQTQSAIKVTLPSGSTSGAAGLTTKSTDLTGYASWSWNISWNTKTGNGKIDLSCTKDLLKSSKSITFSII